MTAEILSVGTELLLGNIVDTNAAFLSQELAQLGVSVFRQTTVGDNHKRLLCALEQAFSNADTVIVTGGLGPTLDDITKQAAAEFFGRELYLHEESLERIKQRFASLGRGIPENSERNAIIPMGCTVLPNDNGSAPGVVIEDSHHSQSRTLILLPGPPSEMIPMFTSYVIPFISAKSGKIFVSRTLRLAAIGESQAESRLLDMIAAQTNPTIAPYAKIGDLHIRLTASANSREEGEKLIAPIATQICERLHPHVYSTNGRDIAEVVLELMRIKNLTFAAAESCTGGLIMSELVGVAGCSDVVLEGVCTYSNESKIARLGVDAELIKKHGAVSAEVAAAMAEGIAKTAGTNIGLSTTGIAGPDGGTADKPVGLVYVGLSINGKTIAAQYNTIGNRNEIRLRAANWAMDFLRRSLQ